MKNKNWTKNSNILLVSIALAGPLFAALQHATAQQYTVTDLGTLGGSSSSATGINNSGQVVGAAKAANGAYHAFLYKCGGAMTDLETFGGSESYANGINNGGQVVGFAYLPDGNFHAFLYSGASKIDLGTLGGVRSQANGINDGGQIVGSGSLTNDLFNRAFLYRGASLEILPTFGGSNSAAKGINSSGQIAGYADMLGNAASRAFLYSGGSMINLGTLGGDSFGYAINNNGQVVGYGYLTNRNSGNYNAFLYSGGRMTNIGTLGGSLSLAHSINSNGQVVGVALTTNGVPHAFLYTAGKMIDLNTKIPTNSGWELVRATGINDVGEIAGFGLTNGRTHAFLLTPNIQHVVLVMMENRSFDHFLGWLPGAEGRQAGLTYSNASGQSFPTWHLAPYFQGCGCKDPDHSYEGGRTEFNTNFASYGACDGWLRANTNDTFSIGYYVQDDLSFFGQVAPNWTVCDHYFAAIMAGTQPNRIYQHAAQTDSLMNRTTTSLALPTIWDRLSQSNVSAHYYYAGPSIIGSLLTLWGSKYSSISCGINEFYQDCANGTLPAVSFVDPVLTCVLPATLIYEQTHGMFGNDTGGNDDHPHSDIRKGEEFLASIYNAVVSSSNWASTVLIINFDEWGGFFDHVAPPVVQVEPAEQALGNDGRLGFRVPCLVISPWSRRGYVTNEVFDHTSVLKLIENRWCLQPLTVRDANANDLADVLDFDHPDFTHPPKVMTPPGLWGGPCGEIQIDKKADGSVIITWDAACRTILLQKKTTLLSPWSDVTGAVSPYVVTPALNQQHFRWRAGN